MKNKWFLFFLLIGLSQLCFAQKKTQLDIWSGQYMVLAKNNNDSAKIMDTLMINKIQDINPKEITDYYQSDLARWSMTSNKEKNKEQNIVRRFLFDLKENRDEYKEFGWTDLHIAGTINCIDGGHFFICQTLPNTNVKFNNDENYTTNTGVFGIWLHYGVVDLKKIKP